MSKIKVFTNNFENKRLDNLLVEMKLVSSRQKAISLIMRGNVFVEEEKVDKPGKVVKINQKISMKINEKDWVSRAGYKLDAVIKRFNVIPKNKICMDIGCSSGGFSDVLIKGNVKKLPSSTRNTIKLPHMGWNSLKNINKRNKLCFNLEHDEFYFLHSYHCVPEDENLIISSTEYGESFCSSIQFENIIGCQFHPEKSHDAGLGIFSNFLRMY